MLIHEVKQRSEEGGEEGETIWYLSRLLRRSSRSKRISTDAILALTSLPNILMDMVASRTTRCRSDIDRTRVQRLKFILEFHSHGVVAPWH